MAVGLSVDVRMLSSRDSCSRLSTPTRAQNLAPLVDSEYRFDRCTLVCHLERPPPRRSLDALHRQPNRLSNRGVEVGDADRAVLDLSTPPVCLPIHLPTLDPRPRQQARERLVVVVAAVSVVDPRRAAELGAQDHQRLVQQRLGLPP